MTSVWNKRVAVDQVRYNHSIDPTLPVQVLADMPSKVLASTPVAVLVVSPHSRVQQATPGCLDLLEQAWGELRDRPVRDLLPEVAQAVDEVIAHHAPAWEGVCVYRTRRGREKRLRVVAALPGGKQADVGCLLILRQAPATRESQLALAQAQNRLADEQELYHQLAQNLHDGVGQNLALAKMVIQSCLSKLPGPLGQRLSEAVLLIDDANQCARSLTQQVSPTVLRRQGLLAAVQWFAAVVHRQHGIAVRVIASDACTSLDDLTAGLAYRIVRELLVNVVKHAQAQQASVRIAQRHGLLIIRVADDGVGVRRARRSQAIEPSGSGLLGLRQKLRSLGGRLSVRHGRGDRGTVIVAVIPKEHIRHGSENSQ